jgi:cell wall-associated NlpC family hydrolase
MTSMHAAMDWNSARFVLALLVATLAGCAGAPEAPDRAPAVRASDETARKALDFAREMVGKPYKYAGNTPAGFDCSGLVNYSYGKAGIRLPRDTRSQRQSTVPVPTRNLRAGDLLFFDQEGAKASHVGLYIGEGRFVHAPSSGGKVRVDNMKSDFWKKHFVDARRV